MARCTRIIAIVAVAAMLACACSGCSSILPGIPVAAHGQSRVVIAASDKALSDQDVALAKKADKQAAKEKAAKKKAAEEKAARIAAEKEAERLAAEEEEAARIAAEEEAARLAEEEAAAAEAEAAAAEEQEEPASEDSEGAESQDDAGDQVDSGELDQAEGENVSAPAGELALSEDYRASFVHGDKGAEFQKYIVLHDTEGDADAWSTIEYWDGNGAGVAAHFIVNKDGSVVQCVPLDKITHHAGFGDTGHNEMYGVEDESRDDKAGTTPIGSWAADYGMNSYSVGIEMVHVGGSGDYPEEQLQALDALIAYIDSYYGFASPIIDHKAWRSGNSDTSPEFAGYLANYQDHRTHL